ncbi:hypothetical protein TSUD_66090 [Trifolium subterraneum]|uniref:Uncharacterized protein n=1 Tax=Trifolium subterraneum TaxID=3900 RepID=A0A2Z6NCV0_TRISU|nr:hypothetical protein TSUD_66090 [Trifolium subterraneum]
MTEQPNHLSHGDSACIWYQIQVGIPIAAGALFPVNGTMLTPSIAGALMGLSSIGVMTNSLLLRFKFSLKQQQIHGTLPKTKTYVESDLARGNKKMKSMMGVYAFILAVII